MGKVGQRVLSYSWRRAGGSGVLEQSRVTADNPDVLSISKGSMKGF